MYDGGDRKGAPKWPYPWWFVPIYFFHYDIPTSPKLAVTASNIVFECDTRREEIESDFAKIPPCTIEKKITVDDKEYPIVRSHHVPDDNEWNSSWDDINRQVLILINFGHGMIFVQD